MRRLTKAHSSRRPARPAQHVGHGAGRAARARARDSAFPHLRALRARGPLLHPVPFELARLRGRGRLRPSRPRVASRTSATAAGAAVRLIVGQYEASGALEDAAAGHPSAGAGDASLSPPPRRAASAGDRGGSAHHGALRAVDGHRGGGVGDDHARRLPHGGSSTRSASSRPRIRRGRRHLLADGADDRRDRGAHPPRGRALPTGTLRKASAAGTGRHMMPPGERFPRAERAASRPRPRHRALGPDGGRHQRRHRQRHLRHAVRPGAADRRLEPAGRAGRGLGVLTIVLCFAEVASRFQEPGGPYLYAREAFGPFVGFEAGWLTFWIRVTAVAANLNVFVDYLARIVPAAGEGWSRAAVMTALVAGVARPSTWSECARPPGRSTRSRSRSCFRSPCWPCWG